MKKKRIFSRASSRADAGRPAANEIKCHGSLARANVTQTSSRERTRARPYLDAGVVRLVFFFVASSRNVIFMARRPRCVGWWGGGSSFCCPEAACWSCSSLLTLLREYGAPRLVLPLPRGPCKKESAVRTTTRILSGDLVTHTALDSYWSAWARTWHLAKPNWRH